MNGSRKRTERETILDAVNNPPPGGDYVWDGEDENDRPLTREEMRGAGVADYLDVVLRQDDPAAITAALGDIARVRGMAQLARDTGLARESLYRALSAGGNPEFATVFKVIRALGIRLHAEAADREAS